MRQGFSLIEISVILLIFGGLAASATMLGSKWVEGTEVRSTKMNIETVEKAIDAYARTNQRLPCPADESIASTDANFGKEAATPGTCTGATGASGQVMRGVVPFQTLGIGKNLAYDPWGHRIAYYVDRRMTEEDAMTTYPPASATIGDIEVQDIAGGQRTNKAVMALVSFGERAHGAKNRENTTITNPNPSAKELENADVNAAGASTGADRVLIQALPGKDPADNNQFDDLVSYKLRSQLGTSGTNATQHICAAHTANWTVGVSCSGSVGELVEGESVVVSDTSAPNTGSVVELCTASGITQSSASCEAAPVDCTAGAVSWTVGGTTCNGTAPATTHGAVTPTISNTTGGRTGSADFTCNNGTFTENGGAICGLNCASGTANWTVGANSCTQTYGALNHNANATITDSTLVDTGNVTVTCTNGSISQSGAACSAGGCAAATLSWGGSCSANVGGPQSNGFSTGITNTASGYDGAATATCTAGAWVLSGTSCNAHCAAQTVNWTVSGQSCSASVGAVNHGNNTTATDSVQDSTGSVTVTCNNGTLNQSGATCVTQCPGGSASWTVSGQTCDASYTDIADSASTSISDAAAPTTGSVTLSCANGVVSQSGATCTAALNCSSGGWTQVADMAESKGDIAIARLGNNNILLCVGYLSGSPWYSSRCDVYNSTTNTWVQVADNPITRAAPIAAPLPDGRVMVCGGWIGGPTYYSQCNAYNSGTNTWSAVASMPEAKSSASAATLLDGRVLVCGGQSTNCYIYNPSTNSWAASASLPSSATQIGKATTLLDGRVLLCGGPSYSNRCDIYNPSTNTWAQVADLPEGKFKHIMATQQDGTALACGGTYGLFAFSKRCDSYNPATNTWTQVSDMPIIRSGHGAVNLANGKTLVCGSGGNGVYSNRCDVYDCSGGGGTPTCSGSTSSGGYEWYLGASGQSCDTVCAGHGGTCDSAGTISYVGSGGSNANCQTVIDLLDPFSFAVQNPAGTNAVGCGKVNLVGGERRRYTSPATTCSATQASFQRVCACNCSPPPPANCSARAETWTVSGQTCTGSTPAITHGNSSVVSDATAPTTGSVTMSCNNGVLSQSGATCSSTGPNCANWQSGMSCTGISILMQADGVSKTQCTDLCKSMESVGCCIFRSSGGQCTATDAGTPTLPAAGYEATTCTKDPAYLYWHNTHTACTDGVDCPPIFTPGVNCSPYGDYKVPSGYYFMSLKQIYQCR